MSEYNEDAAPEFSSPGDRRPVFPPGHRLNWLFQTRRTAEQCESMVQMRRRITPRWIITRDHDTAEIDGVISAAEGTRSAHCTGREDRTGWLRFRLRNDDRVLYEGMAERLTVGPKWSFMPGDPDAAPYRLEYQDAGTGLWTELRPPDLGMPTHPTHDS